MLARTGRAFGGELGQVSFSGAMRAAGRVAGPRPRMLAEAPRTPRAGAGISRCLDAIRANQARVDLARHACSHGSPGVSEGPASALALPARAGLIEPALQGRLVRAAVLGDLPAGQYADLDHPLRVDALEGGLPDLDALVRAVRARARGA